ncbi:alpha/beta hydrolase-fold protein [Myroides fluvii]|uniref:alpha/beta hydrolase-fold protein n=1 Tax=Myroides fluvii TaxID=2572594 RepID=UPI00131C49BD|nr:alpha/beta hydrolase-fold protein [Myroides fluvii]
MKQCVIWMALICGTVGMAQETYSHWVARAEARLELEEESSQKEALLYYQKAFTQFPDSIAVEDVYEGVILAASLQEKDLAFSYLNQLLGDKKDGNGFPGWRNITHQDAIEECKNLLDDPRWQVVVKAATKQKEQVELALKREEEAFFQTKLQVLYAPENGKEVYEQLKNELVFLPKAQRDYSLSFQLNDSTKTSYFIHLPKNYNPTKSYPLLFFLHGAVRYSSLLDFQTAELNLGGWNRYYTKYADQHDVILVFPRANKQYNWMTSDEGFFMIPTILKRIKSAINIDDDKVFLAGHSNGATGVFSYLMKNATPFAGFYGFNTHPKVFTGGTFVANIKNRNFINFSTDQDYYYPPNANDDFTALMNQIKADYKEVRYAGFPHWFPEFDESEPAYQILFADLMQRKRETFPSSLTWEFDDEANGSMDWLQDIKLDTLAPKANWQSSSNFKITKWLEYGEDDDDTLKEVVVDEDAFDFPRASGKIVAEYKNNVYRIKTSRIKSFALAISPEMIDVKKKVKVYVNDQLYYNSKVTYDGVFTLKNFVKNKDRKRLWINLIPIELK